MARHASTRVDDDPHARLVARFYAAFDARDVETMAACYHPDLVFEDPVFGELRRDEAVAMWRMLLAHGPDLRVVAEDVRAHGRTGSARWVATYTFGKRRRPIRNVIEARFAFRDGLIVEHRDRFDFWTWARQAFGPAGWALGWTPFVRRRVQREVRRWLDKEMRPAAK